MSVGRRVAALVAAGTFLSACVPSVGVGGTAAEKKPGDILDLRNWKLTLPVDADADGQPDSISQPDLDDYSSGFFRRDRDGKGVVFSAHVGGVPTVGAKYARTELREMTADGSRVASWTSGQGTHSMTIRQAVLDLPPVRPSVVVGQIHNTTAPLLLIRLDENRLYAKTADGNTVVDLALDYRLGSIFTLRFEVRPGSMRVFYDDVLKADFALSCDTCYFKAGLYLQSNTSTGDDPASVGEAILYDLTVIHGQ